MAKVARQIKVASNPMHRTTKRKGTKRMKLTGAKKAAFLARMAKGRKATSASNPQRRKAKRKSNPATSKNGRSHSNKRRRNPEFLSAIGSPKTLVTQAVAGLVAAAGTRQLPQMIMGAGNSGWKGYLANVGTGLALVWLAGEFVSREAAQAALIGSSVIILDRVLTEKFSPIGSYLQLTGVGDATAATSLGTVADGFYLHPTIVDANGHPIIPHEITDAALLAAVNKFPQLSAPPAQAHSMGAVGRTPRISSRFGSRFH